MNKRLFLFCFFRECKPARCCFYSCQVFPQTKSLYNLKQKKNKKHSALVFFANKNNRSVGWLFVCFLGMHECAEKTCPKTRKKKTKQKCIWPANFKSTGSSTCRRIFCFFISEEKFHSYCGFKLLLC